MFSGDELTELGLAMTPGYPVSGYFQVRNPKQYRMAKILNKRDKTINHAGYPIFLF
jgi:hypothetical protein